MSAEFIHAIRDAGIPIDEDIVADGRLHRLHVDGDKPGSKNAWYVLHDGNHPAGAFGCNKRGISGKWRSDANRPSLTQYDHDRIAAERKAHAEAHDLHDSAAATRAERFLHQATSDALQHAYVTRKGIQPHGVKVNVHNLLVIPIFSAATGKIQTVQFIDRDGKKNMPKGGRCTNGCFPFCDVPNFWANAVQRIGIGEGWATCATVAESIPTVAMFAAFSASNLMSVARALRLRFPNAEITIYGDNDLNQIGQRYATYAARAVDGFIAVPPTPGFDWNDFAMRQSA